MQSLRQSCMFLLVCHLVSAHFAPFECGVCEVNAKCNTNLTTGCGLEGVWNGTWNGVPARPPIQSYHIHIMYERQMQINDPSHDETGLLKLVQAFRKRFGLHGPNCTSLMDEGTWMCEFPYEDPAGTACAMPFMTNTAAFSIPVNRFQETASWIMLNRGTYDIMIHPNTGCMLNDHIDWPLWGGKPWPIRFTYPKDSGKEDTTKDAIMI